MLMILSNDNKYNDKQIKILNITCAPNTLQIENVYAVTGNEIQTPCTDGRQWSCMYAKRLYIRARERVYDHCMRTREPSFQRLSGR